VFVITDSTVRRLYGLHVLHLLRLHDFRAIQIDFPAGERSKNIRVVEILHTALLEAGIHRDSLIVALGGGVVGDIAGFVAATILRGVRYVQVPTTLLAQVDSSVGGKVAIDHPRGKNLIGAFHHPSAVFIDPSVLRTLTPLEFRNGLAEVLKIALALDADFVRWLERYAETLRKSNPAVLATIVSKSVGLKAAVVEKDEKESGLRMALNLGHTIGHALEAATDYRVSHGYAVSVGVSIEAEIAVRLGYLRRKDAERVQHLLRAVHLPFRVPRPCRADAFYAALEADKKSGSTGPRFVLPAGIGRCAIGVPVSGDLVAQVTGIHL
jgi:3-dehydroquinate synthase